MKLEVGMYVRTKWGYICELININDFRELSMRYGVEASYLKDVMFIGDEDILKASHNIIDLIEVGDYVNGYKVIEVDFDAEEEKYIRVDKSQYGLKTILRANDIKSIVTKEAFESMSYRVKE